MNSPRIPWNLFSTAMVMNLLLGCAMEGSGGSGPSSGSVPDPCVWGVEGGGYSFPTCPAVDTSEFVGTIDGRPYDLKTMDSIAEMSPIINKPSHRISMALSDGGSLDLEWGEPYSRGRWTYADGLMFLPGETQIRTVYPGSKLLFSCDDYAFLFILHVWGPESRGELTGCAR